MYLPVFHAPVSSEPPFLPLLPPKHPPLYLYTPSAFPRKESCLPTALLPTNRNPPTSMIKASTPKITASVTMAPMTPATARDIPPADEPEGEFAAGDPEEEEEDEVAQTPVLFPHA